MDLSCILLALEITSLNVSSFLILFELPKGRSKSYSIRFIRLILSLAFEFAHIREIIPTFIGGDIENIIKDIISDIYILIAG